MPPKTRSAQKRKGDDSSIAASEKPSKRTTRRGREASLESNRVATTRNTVSQRTRAKVATPKSQKRTSNRKTPSRQSTDFAELPTPPRARRPRRSSNKKSAQSPPKKEEIRSSPKSAFSVPVARVATAPPLVQTSWSSKAMLVTLYVVLFLLAFVGMKYTISTWLWIRSQINHRLVLWMYLIYSTWRNIPHWVSFVKKKQKRKHANDDLADPFAIIGKLGELQALVSSKNQEMRIDLPWYKLNACFLSMFHLSAEIRKKHPKYRDDQYECCGPAVVKGEVEFLRDMLDYADWAYLGVYNDLLEKLHSRGYQLLRHDTATEPGQVGHFIALNHNERICLIGLKGTSTFSDILTDVVGTILTHELDAPFIGDEVNITCHEGIFTAANVVANDLQKFLERMVIPQSYRIVISGHSLGAGTACLLGLLLRSRIPQLRSAPTDSNDRRTLPLEVVAFATPAVLSYTACVACAPFTTSVVNNSDMVPRLSVSNLLTVNQALLEINRRLEAQGLSPNSFRKAYRFAKDLTRIDEDTLMSMEELDALFTRLHQHDSLYDEHDLYVPGRVIAMFERGEGREVREKQGLEAAVGAVVADGSMKRLRQVELTTSMIRDHFCSSYANNLDDLLRDM